MLLAQNSNLRPKDQVVSGLRRPELLAQSADLLDDDGAQGDIVDLDMNIEVESSQAPLSIQQPQVMEHEHMKMRKGGDLFFGGRCAEDDEVEDWNQLAVRQRVARQAYGTAKINGWAAQSASLSKAQLLGHPMVIRQQQSSSSSANQKRQAVNMSRWAAVELSTTNIPQRQTNQRRSASQNNGDQITMEERRAIEFRRQKNNATGLARSRAIPERANATQNLDIAHLSGMGENLRFQQNQTQKLHLNNPFRGKKNSNTAGQRSPECRPPSLLAHPLLSTQNFGRTLESQRTELTQAKSGQGHHRMAQGQRTKSSMGVFSEYFNLQGLAGGLQQRLPAQQVHQRQTGSSSPIIEQLKTLFNPATTKRDDPISAAEEEKARLKGDAGQPGANQSSHGLLSYIERKSGLNLSNNHALHHTHQDIDANYDMAASLVAVHREKPQQTLEHFPMETLNLNAQQSHLHSMKSTQRFAQPAGPQTLPTQAHTHFVQTQYLHTNTRQTMNQTHMLSQKSTKSRGYNSPNAHALARSSHPMQTDASPKQYLLTQNIHIGHFNQSRQQAQQPLVAFAQRAQTTTRPTAAPMRSLTSQIDRIIKNNMEQDALDRQLRPKTQAQDKEEAKEEPQTSAAAAEIVAEEAGGGDTRGTKKVLMQLNLDAVESSLVQRSKGKEPASGIAHGEGAKGGEQKGKQAGEPQEMAQPDSVRSFVQVQYQPTERLQSFYDSKFAGAQGQLSSMRKEGRLDSAQKLKGDAGVRHTIEQLKMQSPFQMNRALEPHASPDIDKAVIDIHMQPAGSSVNYKEKMMDAIESPQSQRKIDSEKGEQSPSGITGSPPRLGQRQRHGIAYQGSVLGGSVSGSPILEKNFSSPSSFKQSESENVMDTIDREAVEIRNPNRMSGCGGANHVAMPKLQRPPPSGKQAFKLDLEKVKSPANMPALHEAASANLLPLDPQSPSTQPAKTPASQAVVSSSHRIAAGQPTQPSMSGSLRMISPKAERRQKQRTSREGRRSKAGDGDSQEGGKEREGTGARRPAGAGSASSTARQSIGYLAGASSGRAGAQERATLIGAAESQHNLAIASQHQTSHRSDQRLEIGSLAPAIKEQLGQEEDDDLADNHENQKYFKLITNYEQHRTLAQKVIDGITHKANKRQASRKERKPSTHESKDISSFDSVNPQDLILQTIESQSKHAAAASQNRSQTGQYTSQYASHVSQASKLSKFSHIHNILNVQYLHSRDSNASSVHHYNTHQTQTSHHVSDQPSHASASSPGKPEGLPPTAFPQSAQIDKFIDGIEQNLNTFTTEQFEELRQTVKARGFTAAQSNAPELFNLRRGVVRIKPPRPPGAPSARAGRREPPSQDYHELRPGLLRKIEVRDGEDAGEEPETQAFCTGFLSAPTLAFSIDSHQEDGDEGLDEGEGQRMKEKTNQHVATVREDLAGQRGRVPSFLLSHLVSARILESFNRLKCKIISCGLEHCVALMSHAFETNATVEAPVIDQQGDIQSIQPGFVFSWGLGNSGCLGHGDHATVEEPRLIEALTESREGQVFPMVLFVEAGGYHNAAISSSGRALVWGRGDVGQLGISKERLKEDQRGRLALTPAAVDLPNQRVVQLALGEVHSLVLAESTEAGQNRKQQLYSCGWNGFGQLGIPAAQQQQDSNGPQMLHCVSFPLLDDGEKIQKISCGAVFSAALTTRGHVYAWGKTQGGPIRHQSDAKESKDAERSRGGCLNNPTERDRSELEQASGSKSQAAVWTPTRVALDDRELPLEVTDIAAGDRFMIAKTELATGREEARYYAWGHGYLVDEQSDLQELVTNMPVVLGGGVDLVSRYFVERERDDQLKERGSSAGRSNRGSIKMQDQQIDGASPDQPAIATIGFQISATPYQSRPSDSNKRDIVPRLELDSVMAKNGRVPEMYRHNIRVESGDDLHANNLMSSVSSDRSSSQMETPLPSAGQTRPQYGQKCSAGASSQIFEHEPMNLEKKQEVDQNVAAMVAQSGKPDRQASDQNFGSLVDNDQIISRTNNAARPVGLDRESDLVTVKNADDYKSYLLKRENGDTEELSSIGKSDLRVLKLVMMESNGKASPLERKGQHGQGGCIGDPSPWNSNADGSQQCNLMDNKSNSCVTVQDAVYPNVHGSDVQNFNTSCEKLDSKLTSYAQCPSPQAFVTVPRGLTHAGVSSYHQLSGRGTPGQFQARDASALTVERKGALQPRDPGERQGESEFKVSRPKFLMEQSEGSQDGGVAFYGRKPEGPKEDEFKAVVEGARMPNGQRLWQKDSGAEAHDPEHPVTIDAKNYQSGPFSLMNQEEPVEIIVEKTGSRCRDSPDRKEGFDEHALHVDHLPLQFKPSLTIGNAATNTLLSWKTGSISPKNPILTVSTPLRPENQTSSNLVPESLDGQQQQNSMPVEVKSNASDAAESQGAAVQAEQRSSKALEAMHPERSEQPPKREGEDSRGHGIVEDQPTLFAPQDRVQGDQWQGRSQHTVPAESHDPRQAPQQQNLEKDERISPTRSQALPPQRARVTTIKLPVTSNRAKTSLTQCSGIQTSANQHSNQGASERSAHRQLNQSEHRSLATREGQAETQRLYPREQTQLDNSSQKFKASNSKSKLRIIKSHRTFNDYQPVLKSKEAAGGPSLSSNPSCGTARLVTAASHRATGSQNQVGAGTPAHPLKLRLPSRTKPATPLKSGTLAGSQQLQTVATTTIKKGQMQVKRTASSTRAKSELPDQTSSRIDSRTRGKS